MGVQTDCILLEFENFCPTELIILGVGEPNNVLLSGISCYGYLSLSGG